MNQALNEFADYLNREADGYEVHGQRCGIKTPIPALLRKLAVQAKLRAVADVGEAEEEGASE